jgi:hypothetical protein
MASRLAVSQPSAASHFRRLSEAHDSPPCSKTSLVIDRPLAIAWAERHQGERIPELSVMVADRAQVEPQNAL